MVGTWESTGFDDRQFDIVFYPFSLALIEDIESSFEEARRVLAEGGIVTILEHSKCSRREEVRIREGRILRDQRIFRVKGATYSLLCNAYLFIMSPK